MLLSRTVSGTTLGLRTTESLGRALDLFERAVHLDADCFGGHAGIAACLIIGAHAGFAMFPLTAALPKARKAVQRAASLADSDRERAQAKCLLAHITMIYDWDLTNAEVLLEEARNLDATRPLLHQLLAHLYLITGRWEKVTEEMIAARRYDPGSRMLHNTVAMLLYFMREYKRAIQEGNYAVDLEPDFSRGHVTLGIAYEADGQYDRALEHIEKAEQLERAVGSHGMCLGSKGHLYAKMGKPAKARAVLTRLQKSHADPFFRALVHAGLKQPRQAIECLEQAYQQRCDWLIHAGVEPRWDNLRGQKRFQRLLERLKIPSLGDSQSAYR